MTRTDRSKCLPDTEASECYDSHDIYSFNLNSSLSFLNNLILAYISNEETTNNKHPGGE